MRALLLWLSLVWLLAGCGQNTPAATVSGTAPTSAVQSEPAAVVPTTGSAAGATGTPRAITLAMPFIPNVQFAPYYVAAHKGYYAEAGLEVSFDYNYENDVLQRVASEQVPFALAGGTSILLARAQGLPVVSIFLQYQRFPVVLFSKAGSGILSPADLAGRKVGIPGRFGASYYALLALLQSADLSEADLTVEVIGFNQVPVLIDGQVDVVTGYAMNEPIQLKAQGIEVDVLNVSDYFPLVADGLITSERLIAEDPELVRAFVQASARGLADVLADPDAAFAITVQNYIPEAASGDLQLQRQVLENSLPFWQSEYTSQHGLGASPLEDWQRTYEFLRSTGLLASEVDVTRAFTVEFLK